ncbi:MAG: hypothetical protein EFT35_01725 [Methanophagales archaeon ANME-1-THS]|nr:MAG: hypothetical protein EFT35_01725 [Methanophagales archaeon ANME-1-THS]
MTVQKGHYMKRAVLMLVFLALALLHGFVLCASAAPGVWVEPGFVNVVQGENVTVNITVDPAGAEIMGAQYNLNFNTTLLNATKQTRGPFLSQDGAPTTVFVNEINNTIGLIRYGESRTGVNYGVTLPGVLATISFRAMEPGICSLNLSNVKLSDPLAQPIPGVVVTNGTVAINESTFVIAGFVTYSDGSPVTNPTVAIRNMNTSEEFIAESNESSHYYRVSTNRLHINTGDLLYFNASDNRGNVTEFNHRVTEEEITAGGFTQNITIYVPDTSPPLITNISALPTKDSAVITWETDERSTSMVKYGTTPGNYTHVVVNMSYVTYHHISLANLTPNTTYWYVVNSTDPSSNSAQSSERNFTTFAEIVISISDASAVSGQETTVPLLMSNITNVGTADITLSYNQSVVHVTAVDSSDFDFMDATIDNSSGITRIGAIQAASPGLSGTVRLAYITLTAVGTGGESCSLNLSITELKEASPEEITILATTRNGTFFIAEITPPEVTNPAANPASIPEDTDSDPRWGETAHLNVTVTDDCGVAQVTINLSSIGGVHDQQMTRIPGTDIWTVTVNASAGTARYAYESYIPHELQVTATDIFGNKNTSVSLSLVIILNGDVSENGEVSLYDALFIRKYVLRKPGFETMNERVGEVSGNGEVTLYDSMYLSKHVLAETGFETLH